MTRGIERLMVNTVTVQTLTGRGALESAWTDPVTVRCFLETGEKLIVNRDGQEVVSTARLATLASPALFKPGSLVSLPCRQDPAEVITVKTADLRITRLGRHCEVELT